MKIIHIIYTTYNTYKNIHILTQTQLKIIAYKFHKKTYVWTVI